MLSNFSTVSFTKRMFYVGHYYLFTVKGKLRVHKNYKMNKLGSQPVVW